MDQSKERSTVAEDPHARNRRLAARRLSKVIWSGYLAVLKGTDDPVRVSEALDHMRQDTWDYFADLVRVGTPVHDETKALVKELVLAREEESGES